MKNTIFNSCCVKYVYIPKSLQPDEGGYSFYNYFYDTKKYYGGSKEEWAILTDNEDRSEIDEREIT